MNNFKSFVIIAAVLFLTFNLFTSIAEAQKQPVKIGFLGPLSLPGAVELGKRMNWGAKQGIEYVNEMMGGVLGGRPVELVVDDDAGMPADGIAGYRKLAQKDRVAAVMGQLHSSITLALANLSREIEVPVFSTAAGSDKITETESPYIFSIMGLISDRCKAAVDLAKTMGWKRIALMGEDTDYGTGFEKWTKQYAAAAGLEVKSIIFPRTITDFTPSLLAIKAWKPDLFFNCGATPAAYLMVPQAYDIGLYPQVPMLGSYDWPTLPEFWETCKDKGKYILFLSYYKQGVKVEPSTEWMIPRYKKLYN
jgi:branched-chain amino acid transport system substrate-binding protein